MAGEVANLSKKSIELKRQDRAPVWSSCVIYLLENLADLICLMGRQGAGVRGLFLVENHGFGYPGRPVFHYPEIRVASIRCYYFDLGKQ